MTEPRIVCRETYGHYILRPQILPEMAELMRACTKACDETTAAFRQLEKDQHSELLLKFWGSITLIIVLAVMWA